MDFGTETAADVLRRARRRAGLSQAELAARAGVTQSVISAYETGRRQPALSTLAALVDAAGYELTIDVRRPHRLRKLTGPVGRRVRRHHRELVRAAAAHGVTNLRLFGSVARGEDRPDSDVDILADLPAGMGIVGLIRTQDDLAAVVGTDVDLVPAVGLKPHVRADVEADVIAL